MHWTYRRGRVCGMQPGPAHRPKHPLQPLFPTHEYTDPSQICFPVLAAYAKSIKDDADYILKEVTALLIDERFGCVRWEVERRGGLFTIDC